MALSTFVKISNVNNLSDTRYCAGMMVDIIGYNIDPTSNQQVSSDDFKEITEWVAGVKFAGEFVNASIDQIKETVKNYPVDYIQIEHLGLVEQVQLLGKPIIFKITADTEGQMTELKGALSYLDELVKIVIIRSDNPSLFDELDAQIGYYNGNLKLLKGYDLEPSPSLNKLPGLEMEATEEDRPGYKDYGQIMDVLEMIEED